MRLPSLKNATEGAKRFGRRLRSLLPWSPLKTLVAALATAAGLTATVYGLSLYLGQRHEESEALLADVQEAIVFGDPEELTETEVRTVQVKLNQAFLKDRRSSRVWALWGIFQAQTTDPKMKKDALGACQRAMDLDNQNPLVELCTGIALLVTREYKKADQHLKAALRRQPDLPLAWYYHGSALWSLGQNAPAEIALAKARQLAPQRAIYGLELAKFYLLNHNTLSGLQTLREVTAASDSPAARNALATVLQGVGELEAAIEQLEPVIQDPHADPQFLANMACLLNEADRYEEALPVTVRALGAAPRSRNALIESVNALFGLEKYTAALDYSRRLQSVAGDYRWVRTNHEHLSEKVLNPTAQGAFIYGPVTLALCEGWVLTRFSTEFKNVTFAMSQHGKFIFPRDRAGQAAPPDQSALLPSGRHELVISCGTPSSINPDWLGQQWTGKRAEPGGR